MKPKITFLGRPKSSNLEQRTQSQNTGGQNGQFLQSLKNLHKQIEELKDNQQDVSQSLENNLTKISKKIDAMESLINELTSQPISSTMDFYKQAAIGLMKSSSGKPNSSKTLKIIEIIQDQKQNLIEQSYSFQKVENSQQIQADKNKILIEHKQIKRSIQPVKGTSSIGIQLRQQQIQQDKSVKLNQSQLKICNYCQEKGFDVIETPCHHFFDKKCLSAQFTQQLMDYVYRQKFYCICCQQELYSNFFIKHLQLDGEKLFQKQITIIFQKYHSMFNQCKYCQTVWIFNPYQKTNDCCFHCGNNQYR